MIMRNFRRMVLSILIGLGSVAVGAQSSDSLLGKWEAVYEGDGEKATVTYEFSKKNEKLVCHTVYIKDNSGEGGEYNTLAMKSIRFDEGEGKAKYIYKEEDETYEMKAYLELKETGVLKVSYSYWGISETETWKKTN
jgi:hypothetical protein